MFGNDPVAKLQARMERLNVSLTVTLTMMLARPE